MRNESSQGASVRAEHEAQARELRHAGASPDGAVEGRLPGIRTGQPSAAAGPVLIADGDPESRAVLAAALNQAGYRTLEAVTGQEAVAIARNELPRIVIVEVALPGLCGYEVCHQLRAEFGDGLPIVFVSGDRTEPFDIVAALLLGADDYLAKPIAADLLLARLRRLDRRRVPVVPRVAAKLSKREMEVLRLLAEGFEQNDIARELYISRKTVGTHIEHILRKLGVRSRAQAVALAYREELLRASS